ncbi:unnamed protein product, partial [Phaeothamnion confervicola]
RFDRFILQYHIRQFGTRRVARRHLHQLCYTVTCIASRHARIRLFAWMAGIPIMVSR